MTAHVAEAAERSGRVVFWLEPGVRSSPQAFDAAVTLAASFGSEIETVEIEPPHLAAHSLPVRRVESADAILRIDGRDEAHQRTVLAEGQRDRVDTLAALKNVRVRHAKTTGEAIDRLAVMCTERGPWNMVVLSRVPSLEVAGLVNSVFANVSGATGVVVGSRKPPALSARVAVVAEDSERLPSMLRAAARIAGPEGTTHLVISAPTQSAYADLEAQARLLIGAGEPITFEASGPTLGIDGALDELLLGIRPSMVVARYGGALLADGRALSRCLAVTAAPLLLVR